MDTDIFLARCEALSNGLHKLSNEFYASLTDGAPGKERDELIRLAKEKITLIANYMQTLKVMSRRRRKWNVFKCTLIN